MSEPLLVILGPTAVGKSEVALQVAQELDGEIISCDSMQVYKFMDIGTAKPTKEQRALVPHHLIDLIDPDEPYNVARYVQDAKAAIEDVKRRGKLPIIVGGTALYLSALLEGYHFPIAPPDPKLRAELLREAKEKGSETLHRKLQEVDPKAAQRISPKDLVRLVRGLEVYHKTGKPLSQHLAVDRSSQNRYNACTVGLNIEKSKLHERIKERVHRMVAAGLVEEVRWLLERYPPDIKPMRAVGYREFVPVVQGGATLDEAIHACQQHTKLFAKRQMSWFKSRSYIRWLDVTGRSTEQVVERVIRVWSQERGGNGWAD